MLIFVMETTNIAERFPHLRPPRRVVTSQDCDRLLRIESIGHNMDHLVQDFKTALDETAQSKISTSSSSRSRSSKRKFKSTSNLVLASDDSSSSVDNLGLQSRDKGTSSLQLSDSDLELGCLDKGTGFVRTGRNRLDRMQEYRSRRGGADYLGMESDSYTENISPVKKFHGLSTKRKKKFKRMTVDCSTVSIHLRNSGGIADKRKNLRSWSGAEVMRNTSKKAGHKMSRKRKRSAIEKSAESGAISASSRTVSLDDDVKMEMEELGSSSSLSSSEKEWVFSDCDEVPEGEADDEQSDWPGPEPGMSDMQLSDGEIDSEISFPSLLGDPAPALNPPGRALRPGNRKLKGQSIKSAGPRSEFAKPGIPNRRNNLLLKGKEIKRQRRTPPTTSPIITVSGKTEGPWNKYYCGSKSN